jgi:hypothetical protein
MIPDSFKDLWTHQKWLQWKSVKKTLICFLHIYIYIVSAYVCIRLKYHAKLENEAIKKERIRSKLNNLKGQCRYFDQGVQR